MYVRIYLMSEVIRLYPTNLWHREEEPRKTIKAKWTHARHTADQTSRVTSGKFGHQVNSHIRLQTV